MDLLSFYIYQLLHFHLPLPSEVCKAAEGIREMCYTAIGFSLIFPAAIIILLTVILIKKYFSPEGGNNYRDKNSVGHFKATNFKAQPAISVIYVFSLIVAAFFFTDHAMKMIQQPSRFGLEWFTLSYYFWAFLMLGFFTASILFCHFSQKFISLAAITTIIFTLLFSWLGRGNFEQITPIAGGLFGRLSWKMLWLSFSFRLFCLMLVFAVLHSIFTITLAWIKTGRANGREMKADFLQLFSVILWFFLLFLLPVLSIFTGEIYNRADVKQAKDYIDSVKLKADKYYYENGEYPKFISSMLPPGKSPKLLERHEFFTYGVRGTYYFSRKDKYCFIFQNPTRNFGYYSLTSARGWRFNADSNSYDDAFLSLCDESNNSYEDLISNHLGLEGNNQIIDELQADLGTKKSTPQSKEATKMLEQKIMEESKKNPGLLNYFKPTK